MDYDLLKNCSFKSHSDEMGTRRKLSRAMTHD